MSLVDGGELDEVLPAVGAAVGAARKLVKAPHDPIHLDLPVLTRVHRRLELKVECRTAFVFAKVVFMIYLMSL